MMVSSLGFLLNTKDLVSGVYIPKYYNPEIELRLKQLESTHLLVTMKQLINDGSITVSTGDEIGKMAYGTGTIPFIRTSDISNWELKADPKQGVSEEIFKQYSTKQDVRAGDILIVKDGTYLIGQSCIVSEDDLPALYQSHIYKVRVNEASKYSSFIIFAALNSPIFKLQIRSVQFTADIIDTIGNRLFDLKLPIPKNLELRDRIDNEVEEHVRKRNVLRKNIGVLPTLIKTNRQPNSKEPEQDTFTPAITTIFKTRKSKIKEAIFIPKFYDPLLENDIQAFEPDNKLLSIKNLIDEEVVEWDTGIEVGKMAYGTGTIPFIRTSDISNWELKADPKQGVSEEIYLQNKQDVRAEDIFVVRDGTYLVGSSCMVTDQDTNVLYCGGLYKFRVLKPEVIDPYLLLTLLNTPIVRRQMRAKQFTRDIIDTLGKRIFDVKLPIPKDGVTRSRIIELAHNTVHERVALRERSKNIVLELEGSVDEEELGVLNEL